MTIAGGVRRSVLPPTLFSFPYSDTSTAFHFFNFYTNFSLNMPLLPNIVAKYVHRNYTLDTNTAYLLTGDFFLLY